MPNEGPDKDSWARNLGLFSVIVADMVGFTAAGVGMGYWAWKKWNAPWWVLLLTSLTGLSLAMYRIYRLNQSDKPEENSRSHDRS